MPELTPFVIPRSPSPRPAARAVVYEGGAWLFNLGLFGFIIALLLVVGVFLYNRSLEGTRQDWVEQVNGQLAELEQDSATELIDFSNGLTLVRELLGEHTLASNLFSFLEAMTHQRVQFTSFAFEGANRTLDLSGIAASYHTVAEQVRLLEASPEVEKVDFSGLSLSERGTVRFGLAIIFTSALTKLQAP